MILILNGTSSSGKTALARALQAGWPRPLLHLGTDTMLSMLPAAYVGMKPTAVAGFAFVADADERGPLVRVSRGSSGAALEEAFARAVGSLAEAGFDLVLDLVLFDPASLAAYARNLSRFRTYLVGVRCALDVVEARELARGDRFQGLARWQDAIVHDPAAFYDLEVDTTASGPHPLAETILAYVASHPEPEGMKRLAAALPAV